MRLQGIDELPFHQHPAPFNLPATTDAKFNDGYWFSFYGPDFYVVSVLRLHPNVNAIDGAACIAHDDRQHCVRASRALRPRADDLAVGPLRLEVVEPLRRLRLTCAENPSGITFDVEFEGQAPPFVEERYQHYKFGALVNDTLRYTQICRVRGQAALGDREIDVDDWYGMRDHSWGVRTSMGPPTRIGGTDRTEREADRRAIRLWVPFQAGDHVGHFSTHEDRTGTTLDFEGRLDFADGTSVELTGVEHQLEYEPGTPRPIGGGFTLIDVHGERRRYGLRKSSSPADVHGLGYYGGWHDGGSAGMYRGPEHLETDSYDISAADGHRTGPPHLPERRRMGPTEFPCFLTDQDGGSGMAHVEHHIFGPYDPYQFT